MQAVILAAGKGVRLKPLTDNTPKAMVLLKGKPLLEHVLLSLKAAGVEDAVVVVGYLKEKIMDYFGNNFQGMKISYAEQRGQLGTAHAVAAAEKMVNGDFLLGFTDVVGTPSVWRGLIETEGFDAVAAVRAVESPERFGVVEVKGKNIVSVEEKPLKPKSNLVLAGFYRLSPKIFDAIKKIKKSGRGEFELTAAINLLARGGKAGFVECKEKIFDIGTLEELEKAEGG